MSYQWGMLPGGHCWDYHPGTLSSFSSHCSSMDLLHKSHNAPLPYPTMHHFATEMCTCAHFCHKMVHCGYLSNTCRICEMGLFEDCVPGTRTWNLDFEMIFTRIIVPVTATSMTYPIFHMKDMQGNYNDGIPWSKSLLFTRNMFHMSSCTQYIK